MMSEIDPVRFGELLEEMRALRRELEGARSDLRAHDERIISLEDRFQFGKGWIIGMVIGLGFAFIGVKQTLYTLFGTLR